MNSWSRDELQRISDTDDLHIAPLREDGVSYGTPTWIWSVSVDGNLYARAYNGTASSWYRAAIRQKAGRIAAAKGQWDVKFALADVALSRQIDDAYKTKYSNNPYLASMTGEKARAATIAILPART